jgi:hypothetical protein
MTITAEANHYSISGIGIHGAVDTSSISGEPVASLEVDGTPVPHLSFNDTERGLEVSGVVSAVPDNKTEYVTVFLPRVGVEDNAAVTWTGLALITTALQSFAGPSLIGGARHDYAVRPVGGTAEKVDFLADEGADCR